MGEPRLRMDRDAYLAFERTSPVKHELWNGEAYATAGASLAHNWLVANIVEVLSDSTEAFDRGQKCAGYRAIASVEEIVFVSQTERHVECLTRQADGSWNLRDYRDDATVPLSSLGVTLLLRQIYDGVDLTGG